MRARVIIAVVVALIGAGVVVLAPSAAAADIAVTTTDDVVNGGDGLTSLREAFAAANAGAGPDTIILGSAQSYDLDDCVSGALTATADDDLTIDGNGSTITQTCRQHRESCRATIPTPPSRWTTSTSSAAPTPTCRSTAPGS